MKTILKLHGSLENYGGIVALQKELKNLNGFSTNCYYHFETGRAATSWLQSISFFRFFALLLSYLQFPLYLLRVRPDVIEINSSLVPGAFRRDYWYAKIASLILPGAKLVLFNHGWNDDAKVELLKKNKSKLSRYFAYFDCIIVLADRFRRELGAMGVSTPVEVITTAIDLCEFEDLPDGRSPERKRILFLSRLEKEKGIIELLEAVPALLAQYPNLEFCIAGTGSYESVARSHSVTLAYGDNITFWGYIRGVDKLNLLASSDIFVFPSYSEGCPVSVLEALAVGLPIIYTPVGALPDLLEHGLNGIQVELGTSKEVEAAILQLLGNVELMAEMSVRNIKLAKKFDLKVIHKKLEEIYEKND